MSASSASERTVPPADAVDLAEQERPLVDDEPRTDLPEEMAWEADPADTAEQSVEVGYDDDHDVEG